MIHLNQSTAKLLTGDTVFSSGVPTTTPATTIMTSSIITTDSTANTKLTEITTATSHTDTVTTTQPSTGTLMLS